MDCAAVLKVYLVFIKFLILSPLPIPSASNLGQERRRNRFFRISLILPILLRFFHILEMISTLRIAVLVHKEDPVSYLLFVRLIAQFSMRIVFWSILLKRQNSVQQIYYFLRYQNDHHHHNDAVPLRNANYDWEYYQVLYYYSHFTIATS
jgi:hypothetical protein